MSLTTKEVCICDQCGIERNKDTNHWWLLEGVIANREGGFFWASQWESLTAKRERIQHLCGLTCLYKAIDKLAQEILEQERVKA